MSQNAEYAGTVEGYPDAEGVIAFGLYDEDHKDIVDLLRKGLNDDHPYVKTWLHRRLRRAIYEIERLRIMAPNDSSGDES